MHCAAYHWPRCLPRSSRAASSESTDLESPFYVSLFLSLFAPYNNDCQHHDRNCDRDNDVQTLTIIPTGPRNKSKPYF